MNELETPVVVVNFKAYGEVDGDGSIRLAKACETVSKETGVCIAACPPMVELSRTSGSVSIPVLSQNTDPKGPGSATGWVTASMVSAAGAVGTLVNHSEHRVPLDTIRAVVEACREKGLVSIVCAESVAVAESAAEFSPDFIAVEPPELIGGDISVTTANPGIVSDTVAAVKAVDPKVSVLCGAGVKTGADVKAAIELGADGVLLASGVVKSKDPAATLRDLVALI